MGGAVGEAEMSEVALGSSAGSVRVDVTPPATPAKKGREGAGGEPSGAQQEDKKGGFFSLQTAAEANYVPEEPWHVEYAKTVAGAFFGGLCDVVMFPIRLLIALLGGHQVLNWARTERGDRWWWGQTGLGATASNRRQHWGLKLVMAAGLSVPRFIYNAAQRAAKAAFAGIPSPDYFSSLDRMMLAPTIAYGCRELGMKSISEWTFRPATISLKPRPDLVHPLMRPVILLPGLEPKPFYSRADFPWVRALEENHSMIKQEFYAAIKKGLFGSYLIPEGGTQICIEHWRNAFFVNPHGKPIQATIDACPKTWAVLNSIPGFVPNNMTMFSSLDPGGRIYSHVGLTNACCRVHLGINVPEPAKSVIRVGEEVRTWQEGKALIFNDAFDHEVWNFGERTRAVLFFDVWHPGLTPQDLEVIEPGWQGVKDTLGEVADNYERMSKRKREEQKGQTWFVGDMGEGA